MFIDHSAERAKDQPVIYQITLEGHLAERWADWFGSMIMRLESNGSTRLTGSVIDQAALHGLLKKVRDLGMPLISVARVDLKQLSQEETNAKNEFTRFDKETKT